MGTVEREQTDSLNKLKNFLSSEGIDISKWGEGEAKSLNHLYNEIQKGESILMRAEHGEIVRNIRMAGVDIYYSTLEGHELHLIEDKQVFSDGRIRRRDYGHAVSEKLKPDEDPLVGAIRGIQEELGVWGDFDIALVDSDTISRFSPSYPNLPTEYVRYHYRVELREEQFEPDGYIEEGSTATTYFKWEEVE
jgi:hypothetical protein